MTRTVKRKTVNDPVAPETAERAFADNRLAMELFGSHHRNLARIEQVMDVAINARGNEVTITGDVDAVNGATRVLDGLYGRLRGATKSTAKKSRRSCAWPRPRAAISPTPI